MLLEILVFFFFLIFFYLSAGLGSFPLCFLMWRWVLFLFYASWFCRRWSNSYWCFVGLLLHNVTASSAEDGARPRMARSTRSIGPPSMVRILARFSPFSLPFEVVFGCVLAFFGSLIKWFLRCWSVFFIISNRYWFLFASWSCGSSCFFFLNSSWFGGRFWFFSFMLLYLTMGLVSFSLCFLVLHKMVGFILMLSLSLSFIMLLDIAQDAGAGSFFMHLNCNL